MEVPICFFQKMLSSENSFVLDKLFGILIKANLGNDLNAKIRGKLYEK